METRITLLLTLVLWLASSTYAHAQSLEWQELNAEVTALYQQGRYDKALAVAKEALDVAEKEQVPSLPTIATSLNDLALLYQAQGQYAQAEPLYKSLLSIFEKALGPDHSA